MKCGNHNIKLVGLGGGGNNMANSIANVFPDIAGIAIDTDSFALRNLELPQKILIGRNTTRGLGTGANLSLANIATDESKSEISNALLETDLLFITVSLGGGTGTALAPIATKIAKDSGAKVIAFCTLPFSIEGAQKCELAERELKKMKEICDIVVALPNDEFIPQESTQDVEEALQNANRCIAVCVKSICKILAKSGIINVDFSTLSNLLEGAKSRNAIFSYGRASGENCATNAIKNFNEFPISKSELNAKKADKLLVCAYCSKNVSIEELKSVLLNATAKFSNNENVVFGAILEAKELKEIEVFAIGLEFFEEIESVESEPVQKKFEPVKISRSPIRVSKAQKTAPNKIDDSQSEFNFVEEDLKRGYFESTQPNLHDGVDLDIPTFIRKRISI